jgi:hypothetical protein
LPICFAALRKGSRRARSLSNSARDEAHRNSADHVGPVHFPNPHLTARGLQQNVGMAIAIVDNAEGQAGKAA